MKLSLEINSEKAPKLLPRASAHPIQLKLAFQQVKADEYCCGEIDLILHLTFPVLFDDYGVCNSGTEVIHQQSCKYLLLYRCLPM